MQRSFLSFPLQQTMLSMRNQSQINSSAISGYQEEAFVVGKSFVEKERTGRISASLVAAARLVTLNEEPHLFFCLLLIGAAMSLMMLTSSFLWY